MKADSQLVTLPLHNCLDSSPASSWGGRARESIVRPELAEGGSSPPTQYLWDSLPLAPESPWVILSRMTHETLPPRLPDDFTLAAIEDHAARMARRAGQTLMGYFGTPLDIDFKDEHGTDPVTNVDREVQNDLVRAISEAYPEHGIVGEEDEDPGGGLAPDFVWVLDPLDGTKNFMNGLPIFASSIGVLHRGAPVAGAVYTPWPGEPDGVVLHARTGGGTYAGSERISLADAPEPVPTRLTGLPESFHRAYRFDAPIRGRTGELRTTGSTVYELAMAARGVVQYSFFGAPHLWDAVAGSVLVAEAGGLVMTAERRQSRIPLVHASLQWSELDSFFPDWDEGVTLERMRRWRGPLLCGSPKITRYVARNLHARR